MAEIVVDEGKWLAVREYFITVNRRLESMLTTLAEIQSYANDLESEIRFQQKVLSNLRKGSK